MLYTNPKFSFIAQLYTMKSSKPTALSYDEAFGKAAKLCSKAEKSRKDIMKKLEAWNVAKSDRKKIIEQLEQEQFIDEVRFAETYTREKFHLNGWGRHKLRYGLKNKGIAPAVIEDAIQVIDEEEYLSKLLEILHKKRAGLHEQDPRKRKAKLIRHAASKGFEEGLVKESITMLLPEEE